MSNNKAQEEKPTEELEETTEAAPTEKRKKTNIEIYNEEKLKRAGKRVQNEKDKSKLLLEELVKSYKSRADKETIAIIKDLALEDQLTVLKAKEKTEKTKAPEPNTGSIPTPLGPVQSGLEKYMKFNQYTGEISWIIPASVLLNPEKNKKLGEMN